jgi:hypothetical protein
MVIDNAKQRLHHGHVLTCDITNNADIAGRLNYFIAQANDVISQFRL